MIFCTRKTKKDKVSVHKQISFGSFKKYLVDEYPKALVRVIFPNYKKYSNVNKAHNVSNKAKRRISKPVFKENKARKIFRKTNIGTFSVLCFLEIPVLKFALLYYY